MEHKVRWGIMATGAIAHKFATGLQAVPEAELVAVGSRSQEAADRFADEFSAAHRHASYEALARDPDVEIVYVASPHPFHKANTLLCLDHGKAVLCEKPFAINEAQAREMVASARQKKLFLMEAMWTHCFPAIHKVQELISQGVIGEVRLMRAEFCFRAGINPNGRLFDLKLGGGGLLDVGVYTVALAHLIYGQEPREILSMAHIGETGVDEQAVMLMRYEAGAMALLTCAVRTSTPHEAAIFGTEGHIRIPHCFWQPDKIILCKDKEEEMTFERLGNGYSFEAREAGRCLRQGLLESPVMPWEKTLDIVRTMDKVRSQWGLKYPGE